MNVAAYFTARIGLMVGIDTETYRAIAAMPMDSACGKQCCVAIDGVALVIGTLGHNNNAIGRDLARYCLEAVSVMVCG